MQLRPLDKLANARLAVQRLAVLLPALTLAGCALLDNSSSQERSLTLGLLDAGTEAQRLDREERFIAQLLAGMSLPEKVGQMIQAEIQHITPDQVAQYGIGSVLNGGGSYPHKDKHAHINDWRDTMAAFHQASVSTKNGRTPIPVLWGTDAVHGHNNLFGATIFPHNIGLGAANNPALTRDIFAATAKDVRSTGVKWAFAPTVAVARDDRWGRTYESFSETPQIVSELAQAAVIGLQGQAPTELADNTRVIATAKHFIGDGGTLNGIDQGDTQLDKQQLFDIHGQSFTAAIDAGVQTIMASFNSWNGEKVHGSSYLINDVLKQDIGFDGFVIGDWNGHAQVPGCHKDSCPAAINAGIDMLMVPQDWQALHQNTVRQVEAGEISLARIDDAVTRILRVKIRAGMFDENYALWLEPSATPQPETQQLAREAVRQSLVLLKNNRDALPLRGSDNILVIGSAANSIAQQSGGWTLSWQGDGNSNADFPNGTSILQGIEQAAAEFGGEVLYDHDGAFTINTPLLQQIDSAIVVFGEEPYAEGAGDREHLGMPEDNYALLSILEKLQQQGIPVTSLLISGRPLSINHFINRSDAMVAGWLPGTEGGGIADVLIGDADKNVRADFTGRLAFSWPKHSGQTRINGYPEYSEQPEFALGYGLSYNTSTTLAQLAEGDKLPRQSRTVSGSLPIFIKKVLQPWSLFVGDDDNWGVAVNGNRGATINQKTVLVAPTDNNTQEDARLVRWTTSKTGQFYFQHSDTLDLSQLAERRASLKFQVRVQEAPQGKVKLRMDCHYPCSGQVDVTDLLRSMPEEEWQSVAVDLQCFAASGANLSRIDTPFLLSSDAQMALEISNILIDAETPSQDATRRISCENAVSQLGEHGMR